jgi:hypothetical protein
MSDEEMVAATIADVPAAVRRELTDALRDELELLLWAFVMPLCRNQGVDGAAEAAWIISQRLRFFRGKPT